MRAPYIVSLQDENSITHLTACVHEVNGANDRQMQSEDCKVQSQIY